MGVSLKMTPEQTPTPLLGGRGCKSICVRRAVGKMMDNMSNFLEGYPLPNLNLILHIIPLIS